MSRFILPVIIIVIAIGGFFMYTDPLYKEINTIRAKLESYDIALNNSKSIGAERDKLVQKYNAIDPENLQRIEKLLPDNVDNIRLILEMGKIAEPYGMVLENLTSESVTSTKNLSDSKTTTASANTNSAVSGGTVGDSTSNNYGVWNLGFSVTGSYSNFLNLLKDLENNLRIVDIASISFTSNAPKAEIGKGLSLTSSPSDVYTYDFKIKTYWLKN